MSETGQVCVHGSFSLILGISDRCGWYPPSVEAIEAVPTPTNVTELKSYVGMLTYYGKFLPDLATKLSPLYLSGYNTTQ